MPFPWSATNPVSSLPHPAYSLQPSKTRKPSRIGCTCLGSGPQSPVPQAQSGTALPCTWRQAARKEGSSGVGAAVTLVPPARQKAPWGQGLGLPVLWSPQDRALPTVGDQSCWLPDRGMYWMTSEVTLSPLTAIQQWYLLQPLCGFCFPNKSYSLVPLSLCTCSL